VCVCLHTIINSKDICTCVSSHSHARSTASATSAAASLLVIFSHLRIEESLVINEYAFLHLLRLLLVCASVSLVFVAGTCRMCYDDGSSTMRQRITREKSFERTTESFELSLVSAWKSFGTSANMGGWINTHTHTHKHTKATS